MDIDKVLTRGVEDIIVKESLIKRLKSGKKLKIKLGIDPTGTNLHLGHAVVLRKLRELQDLGHQAILVIGDYTARIGDPSGKTQSRKLLSTDEVVKNMQLYKEQACKILNINSVEFVYNSQWLGKMTPQDIFELASKATVAQIFERSDFRSRIEEKSDISYLEVLYPLMQGYDSVQLKADVELGGRDQRFNLLMGRQVQKRYDQKEQDIIIMKLLSGSDGSKMSKSADNYISLLSDENEMYGKLMSIDDELIKEYFELCTYVDLGMIDFNNPYEAKKKLSFEIVSIYHGCDKAKSAEERFIKLYKDKIYRLSDIEELIDPGVYDLRMLPILSKATTSNVQAKRLILQGAVEINGRKFQEVFTPVELKSGDIIKIGKKRFLKVK